MKEAYLYQKLNYKKVRCNTCNHRCLILPGGRGICGIRKNIDGKEYLLTYGKACAENIDPIEKKPLYHFMQGSLTLTIATSGCNFRCLWCQNFDISQGLKRSDLKATSAEPSEVRPPTVFGYDLPPEKVIEDTIDNKCPSISYSYTEPTVYLEYALDTMKLAHKKGLKNIWVSNGYMSKESLDLISPYLNAINVDIKTIDKEKFQKFVGAKNPEFVLENCIELVKRKIHLEVTTLVVPTVNDSKKDLEAIANFIHNKLGPEIPWHLSRYYPTYKMTEPTTPIETLKLAENIGKKSGLKYVYIGNV